MVLCRLDTNFFGRSFKERVHEWVLVEVFKKS
jgi:hypothetical protein